MKVKIFAVGCLVFLAFALRGNQEQETRKVVSVLYTVNNYGYLSPCG